MTIALFGCEFVGVEHTQQTRSKDTTTTRHARASYVYVRHTRDDDAIVECVCSVCTLQIYIQYIIHFTNIAADYTNRTVPSIRNFVA